LASLNRPFIHIYILLLIKPCIHHELNIAFRDKYNSISSGKWNGAMKAVALHRASSILHVAEDWIGISRAMIATGS